MSVSAYGRFVTSAFFFTFNSIIEYDGMVITAAV